MTKSRCYFGTGGASLVEVLLAVAILVISVSALSYYYPISMRAIPEARHRNSASALANSKLEQMKMQPYGTVRLLPASNFPNPTNCDCRTIDFASATLDPAFSETVVNGPITYQRKVCVNRMQRTVTGDLVPQCNNWSDTGLKNIVVAVSWKTGNQPKTVVTETMLSLQSQPVNGSLASTMTVTVCGAQLANPTQCDNAKQAAINATTTVSLFDPLGPQRTDNGGALPGGSTALMLPPGTYTLHVQAPGYFPYHEEGIPLASGAALVRDIRLRSRTDHASHIAGEIFAADHLVISKIVSEVARANGIAGCIDATKPYPDNHEVLEIYNPTNRSWQLGTDFHVTYYGVGTSVNLETITISRPTIPSHGYFLVRGIDNWHITWPSRLDAFPTAADILYNCDPIDPSGNYNKNGAGQCLIPWTGGGIRITDASNNEIDAVRWDGYTGISGSPPVLSGFSAAPDPNPGVIFLRGKLPQGSIRPQLTYNQS